MPLGPKLFRHHTKPGGKRRGARPTYRQPGRKRNMHTNAHGLENFKPVTISVSRPRRPTGPRRARGGPHNSAAFRGGPVRGCAVAGRNAGRRAADGGVCCVVTLLRARRVCGRGESWALRNGEAMRNGKRRLRMSARAHCCEFNEAPRQPTRRGEGLAPGPVGTCSPWLRQFDKAWLLLSLRKIECVESFHLLKFVY